MVTITIQIRKLIVAPWPETLAVLVLNPLFTPGMLPVGFFGAAPTLYTSLMLKHHFLLFNAVTPRWANHDHLSHKITFMIQDPNMRKSIIIVL